MDFRFIASFLMVFFTSATALVVQHNVPVRSSSVQKKEERVKISLCDLKKDPAAYNHKLVEVTGFISHGFEDFTMTDMACPSWPRVWLEYGGTTVSGTMYCCGVTSARSRPKPLVVENIAIEFVADDRFKQFDMLIQRPPDSIVRATLVGRFFSGKQVKYPGGTFWSGYGHMGCCSLLAIQQVLSVDPHDSTELDYRASAEQPNLSKGGCGYTFLTDVDPSEDLLKAQTQAEAEEQEWRFSDPKRVATEGLARLINVDPGSVQLRQTQQAQGRFIYEWCPAWKKVSYMIVVSRPYLLSFYAKNPKRVAWVVLAAYESSCGGRNSVQRIR